MFHTFVPYSYLRFGRSLMNKTIPALLGSFALSTAAHAAPIQPCPSGKTYADYITLTSCLLGDKAFSNFELRLVKYRCRDHPQGKPNHRHTAQSCS